MSDKKIIAVATATGAQGSSVVRELLKDGTFVVRGLTRNPSSAKAQELAKQGVEIVKADLGDLASLEKAFEGVYGVYGNTVWALFPELKYDQVATRDAETQHGKNLIDAAKKNGVQAFVWSCLDKVTTEVYHYSGKYNVSLYLEQSGIPYWTTLYTSFYFENLTMRPGIQMIKKTENGGYILNPGCPPDVGIDFYDPADTGYWVLPILRDGPKHAGKRVDAAAERLSLRQIGEKIKSLTGVHVQVPELTEEEFLSDEFRKGSFDEMWIGYLGWVRGELKRDYKQSYEVALSKPSNFEEWLKKSPETWQFLGVGKKS